MSVCFPSDGRDRSRTYILCARGEIGPRISLRGKANTRNKFVTSHFARIPRYAKRRYRAVCVTSLVNGVSRIITTQATE